MKQRRRLRHAAEDDGRRPDRDGPEQGKAAVPDGPRHVVGDVEEAFAQRGAVVDRFQSSRWMNDDQAGCGPSWRVTVTPSAVDTGSRIFIAA